MSTSFQIAEPSLIDCHFHLEITDGYLYSATVFSAELSESARQESVSEVQANDGEYNRLAPANHWRRNHWDRVLGKVVDSLNGRIHGTR